MTRYFIFFFIYFFSYFSAAQNHCEPNFIPNALDRIAFSMKKMLPMNPLDLDGVFARVLRGQRPEEFDTFSNDGSRILVMAMDKDGLATLSGSSPEEMLIQIGYEQDYIDDLRQEGYQLKMVLFRIEEGLFPATWDGLGLLLGQVYGDQARRLFRKYRSQLERLTFQEIERLGPSSFKTASRQESGNRVTFANLNSESSLWEFRAFLYNELFLTELYAGDGFTKTKDGERGVAEYFLINRSLSELPDFRIVEL